MHILGAECHQRIYLSLEQLTAHLSNEQERVMANIEDNRKDDVDQNPQERVIDSNQLAADMKAARRQKEVK